MQNAALGGAYLVDRIETGDGRVLLAENIMPMVQAMAPYTLPALGQTTLPPELQEALAPAMALYWG